MAWFKRVPKPITAAPSSRIPEGVWVKCPDCGQAYVSAVIRRAAFT